MGRALAGAPPLRAAAPAADRGLAAVEPVSGVAGVRPRDIALTQLMPVLIHISSLPLVQGAGFEIMTANTQEGCGSSSGAPPPKQPRFPVWTANSEADPADDLRTNRHLTASAQTHVNTHPWPYDSMREPAVKPAPPSRGLRLAHQVSSAHAPSGGKLDVGRWRALQQCIHRSLGPQGSEGRTPFALHGCELELSPAQRELVDERLSLARRPRTARRPLPAC